MDKLVLPKEFIDKYQKLLATKASSFFTALEAEPKKAFRLNPLKANYQKVSYDLSEPVNGVEDAYYGEISGRDIEWVSGYVYSQDPSAMYPAEATWTEGFGSLCSSRRKINCFIIRFKK